MLYLPAASTAEPEEQQRILDDLSYPTMVLKSVAAAGSLPEPAVDVHLSTLALEAKLHQKLACTSRKRQPRSTYRVHLAPQYIPNAPQRLYVHKNWLTDASVLETLRNLSFVQGEELFAKQHQDLAAIDQQTMFVVSAASHRPLEFVFRRNAKVSVLPWPQALHPTAREVARKIDGLVHMPENSRERPIIANFSCIGCERSFALDSSYVAQVQAGPRSSLHARTRTLQSGFSTHSDCLPISG